MKLEQRYTGIIMVFLSVLLGAGNSKAQMADNGNTPNHNKRNIVRLAPLAAMDVGFGFGFGYERYLNKSKTFSAVMPLYLILENRANSDSYGVANSQNNFNAYCYANPGLKWYVSHGGKLHYALGPSVMLGYGGSNDLQTYTANGTTYYQDAKTSKVKLGVLLNNYVQYVFGRRFELGLEGGLGLKYLDKTTYSSALFYTGSGKINSGFDITGQFALSFGAYF
ncbi:MAG: hypothetical protein QM642_02770 [Edaphocola sp.]